MVAGYDLDCLGSNPGGGKIFLLSTSSRPDLGSIRPPMGIGDDFPRVKVAEA
jgi:hypothetical protein